MAGVSGVILAGGESLRMGRDKRLLPIDGEPMFRRVVRAIAGVADDLVVVDSQRSPLPISLVAGFALRVVRDEFVDSGPLAGIEAGLRAVQRPTAVVVAADAPWLQPPLLRLLVETLRRAPGADVAVVTSPAGPEPLPGAYRATAAEVATGLLASGERRLRALLDVLSVEVVAEPDWRAIDPEGLSLRNLNEPTDLPGARGA